MKANSFRLKAFFKDNMDTFSVFVAGSSGNMPQGVERALKEVMKEQTGSEEGGVEMYEQLARSGRIQYETWS